MPRKPKYINPDQTIEDFYASVSDAYNSPGEGEQGRDGKKKQELLAEEFGISRIKVRKILITGGCWTTERSREVCALYEKYGSVAKVAKVLGLSETLVKTYLPYGKVVYDLEEKSGNAKRVERWREKRNK